MRAASCFSGIGAPELAGPQFEWVWCAEVEKFPSAVLAHRFPHSTNLGDVTADDFLQRASAFGRLDLLVGGPPCQDFSVAGLRAGVAGDRGNLSLRFMEIAHAIRPRNLLVENVPGWLNMPDNAFGCFLGALVGADDALRSPLDGKWPSAGMVAGPRARAAWRVFDAQYFGVAQRRRRVFVVADFGEGADPAAVLFERQGMRGNSPPRREAGQGTAGNAQAGAGSRSHWDGDYPHPTLNQSTGSSGGVGASNQEIFSQRGAYLVPGGEQAAFGGGNSSGPVDISPSLLAHGGPHGRQDFSSETFIAHSLRGEGFDASEDGTGRGTPIVPVHCIHADAIDRDGSAKADSPDAEGRMRKRDAGMGISDDASFNLTTGRPHAIAFTTEQTPKSSGEVALTLTKQSPTGGGQIQSVAYAIQAGALRENPDSGPDGIGVQEGGAYTLEARAEVQAVAWSIMPQNSGKDFKAREVDVAQPIMAGGPVGGNQGGDYIQQAWQVRRLTPTECERLQSFPDGFTNITYRGKPAADGPRYKALGNSWAASNGAWIIERLAGLLEHERLAA